MRGWAKRLGGALRRLAPIALAGALTLTGCSKPTPQEQPQQKDTPNTATDRGGSPASETGGEASLPPPPRDWQHEPFEKVTRRGEDPPEGARMPTDMIANGKPSPRIYGEVVRLWDTIRFVTPAGKRLDYSATIETDQGNVEIALRPDLAPSHVRSFVALSRAGYYDNLFFDRIRHEESEEAPGRVLDLVEAGCPLGTGDPGCGSIGYWLKPEFPREEARVTHEEGTVGACHDAEADTAACRFYITLKPAPFLDGNFTIFGKVTQGMDVVRKIFLQPVIVDDEDAEGSHRPEKPVVIRKVTIHTHETEAQAVANK
jgi:cyclophilin family peptidyl-prolyl cis-trans isomerase